MHRTDPSSGVGKAGPFARALLVVHGLSFLGNAYYLLPKVLRVDFPFASGFVPDERPYPGWTETFFAGREDVAGWGSAAALVLLSLLAAQLGRSAAWAVAAGVTSLALFGFWSALGVTATLSGRPEGGMIAFYVVLAAAWSAAGAAACFVHAGRLRAPEGTTAPAPHAEPALPSQRVWARVLDVVIIGLAFLLQTVLSDAVGGLGSAGSMSERWVSASRWCAVLLAEAACVASFGQTPGKALVGLQVRTPGGARPGWISALVRSALILFGAFFAWTIYALPVFRRSDRAGLHDLAAGTRVVATRHRFAGLVRSASSGETLPS